jgi:gas vesicle protein
MKVLSFFGGLLSGGIVGAAVAILLAPHSGAESRRIISDKAQDLAAAGKQAAEEKRRELQREYEAAIRIPLPVERTDNP